jgi:hypothetical protein
MHDNLLKSNSRVIILPTVQASTGTTVYSAGTLPDYLSIDSHTGIIYGYLTTQTEYQKNYSVPITSVTTGSGSIITATNTVTLIVRGGDPDVISWISPDDLGTITAGKPSNISIQATHTEKTGALTYIYGSMVQASFTTTSIPSIPGLSLNTSTGNITGTPTTTGTYRFAVIASTGTYYSQHYPSGASYPYPYSIKSFYLTVPVSTACTNIYIEPLLSVAKRKQYNSFVADAKTFIPELIYRADDPNFGVQTDIRMALVYGIQQLTLSDFSTALSQNFSQRRFRLSGPQVAVATDTNNHILYEAVYLDVIDDQAGAALAVTVSGRTVYPATIDNMRARLSQYAPVTDPEFTPRFLYANETPQYKPVVVLCYATPGHGHRIARNILKTGFDFGAIDFDIDRIVVETSLDNTQPTYLGFPRAI